MLKGSGKFGLLLGFFCLGGILSGREEAKAQPPEPAVVEGTVLASGGALLAEGATVTLKGQGAWSDEQPLQPDGSFLFPQVPPGAYELRVQAEGLAELVLRDLQMEDGEQYHWELQVVPPKIMRGRILRADGSPLANTWVEFLCRRWAIMSALSGPSFQHTNTDGGGRYELQIEEGPGMVAQVLLVHPEEGYAFSPFLPFTSEDYSLDLDFRLQSGHTLTGVIREAPTQAPIPDLRFALKPGALLDLPGFEHPQFEGTTDSDGIFSFQHLPPGIYELSVDWHTSAPYRGAQQVVVMGEPEIPIAVDWELPRRSKPTLTLQLHQPDGSPLGDTRVPIDLRYRFSCSKEFQVQEMQEAQTDAQGQLKFPLFRGSGTYQVILNIEGYQRETVENIILFDDSPGLELEITLRK